MNFLTPWFLGGLAALAVPIAIHLINRERKTVVPFPSLMFIQKVPYKSVRRQKLRHLLLFLMRCTALALLVAAFGRPFFSKRNHVAAAGGARERVILLDRSYSMGYGTRWQAAIDSAKAAVGELGPQDRVTVMTFANDVQAITNPMATRAEVDRALERVTLSAEGTRYGPALKLAGDALASSSMPTRDIVLISDFQRRGWSTQAELRMPPGIDIRGADVSTPEHADVAVMSVANDRESADANAPVTVTARLTNTASVEKTVQATLELAGRVIGSTSVTIPATGSAQARFPSAVVPGGVTKGLVHIPGDSLTANDAFHFTLAPDEAVSVLVVEPTTARTNQSLFFRRALEIGDTPRFTVDVKRLDSLTPRDFANRGLVVLNEVAPPGGELGNVLRGEVRDGVGLLVVPADVASDRVPREWQALVRVGTGEVVNRSAAGGTRIARVSYASPVFEAFAAPGSGDFASAHVFRHRNLRIDGDSGIIAWFDDGTPALVERRVGLGRIMVWASTIDEYWNDLPTNPVFLPFVRQLARHTGRFSDSRAFFTAGDVLDLTRHGELLAGLVPRPAPGAERPTITLVSPTGKRVRFTDTLRATALQERGFYELRGPTTAEGSGRAIAVNVDLAESDLSHMEPQELVTAALAGVGAGGEQATTDAGTAAERERTQRLWWYLLVGAFLILATETLISNRLSRTVTT